MATVAPEVRGAQPAPTPPVRHGTCRLIVIIDGTEYRLSRSPSARAAWHLKRLSEPREGTTYRVLTHKPPAASGRSTRQGRGPGGSRVFGATVAGRADLYSRGIRGAL
jgi:hypothetical protein